MKRLLLFLLLASPAMAQTHYDRFWLFSNGGGGQTHTFPALDTNNAFTGNNTHSGTETFNAVIALPNTTSASAGVITIGGAQFIHNFATNPATAENAFIGAGAGNFTLTGVLNTAVGSPALNGLTSGNSNSAFGAASMSSNTSGGGNAAFGDSSLTANTTGISNAAFGHFAMKASTTAQNNSAFGNTALSSLVGGTTTNNSAFGAAALLSLTTGTNNNGFGVDALRSLTTGSNNMAFGVGNGTGPGANYTGAESNNIVIGNSGTVGESGAIRIGTPSIQLETYLINPTAVGAVPTLTGTGACATITTQHGGSWAGDAKCTGTTGASTLTITPGITAANGWVCYVQDETTRANLFQQTSHSPTACTLTVTSVTQNDVFVFSAIAY